MTHTYSKWSVGVLVIFGLLLAMAPAFSVHGEERGSRDRGSTGRVSEPEPTPPPAPTPLPVVPSQSGGIESSTNGTVDTGGNTGGSVTTGDENVEVYEINIGPTNPPENGTDVDEEESPPAQEPQCDTSGRTRSDCTGQAPERTR